MNKDQIFGVGRLLLASAGTSLGTWLITKGYLTPEAVNSAGAAVEQIAAVLVPTIPVLYSVGASLVAHSRLGKLKSVANMTEVQAVQLHPGVSGAVLASQVPSTKVTAL